MKQSEIFYNAKWIDCPNGTEAPLFRREFSAQKGEKAEIIICGLGFFELRINGRLVSDDLLVPNASNYSSRDLSKFIYPINDKLSFRTYCMKYDISKFLKKENVISVMLGGGYYHQEQYIAEGNVSFGTPKLCFVIIKDSGNVVSDKNTLCHKGFFSKCNLYYGEKQDLSQKPWGYELPGYSGNDFVKSREIKAPVTEFYIQNSPADKVCGTITDIKLISEKGNVRLYDIGKNISGRIVIKCTKPNEKIVVRYAEQLEKHHWWGIHFDKEKYTDEFITCAEQTEYSEIFGWQGFRYVEVIGEGYPVRAEIVHSDCKITSKFECDNENLNWLYNTYIHTQLCNMHAGVPSDCPHRERLGYTGDGQLCAETAMLLLDSKSFYRKWLDDIADSQCKKSGHVEHTAPFMGGGGGPCGWGGAIVEVPYKYYKIYGDKDILVKFFPKMLNFLKYLDSRSENGLVSSEEDGGWCLGDWLPPQPIQIPETYVNTCLYIEFMKQVKEIAEIIGKSNDVLYLEKKIEKSSKMVNAAYYSFQQRAYCGDINGASCLAMSAGIGNDLVRERIVEKYRGKGEYDTGIIATLKLTEYLFNIGENDIAISLLAGNKKASFANMKNHGATTLWENWDGQSSQNHPMFGAVTKLLFTKVLGIEQEPGSSGFEKVIIKPHFSSHITKAKGSVVTEKGIISVQYKIIGNKVKIKIHTDPQIKAQLEYNGHKYSISDEKELTLDY